MRQETVMEQGEDDDTLGKRQAEYDNVSQHEGE